jgi:energy-coupling factor transporter ATP-binding protein EcfA2
MTTALETVNLEKQFGGLKVTRDLSLKIEAGARHALIGPNGAGKTTVINLLTGVLKPNGGRILLEGADITDLTVHKRVTPTSRRWKPLGSPSRSGSAAAATGGAGWARAPTSTPRSPRIWRASICSTS